MSHKILSLLAACSLFFYSCEEIPVLVNMEETGTDTTYVAPIEVQQEKKYLIEELSGVTCVNCPAGTQQLHDLNASGEFAGKLVVLALHTGSFTSLVHTDTINSIQDFRTTDADQILANVFGGEPGKPCAGFDRLHLSTTAESKILDYRNRWNEMLAQAKNINSANPVNVYVNSAQKSAMEYNIEVKVAYTQAMTGKQAITLYLAESDIIDAQQFPDSYKMVRFNHVFRKSISPYTGIEVLKDLETKEAGRVIIQNFTLKIDPNDAKQKLWNADNLELIAFVHNAEGIEKKVYQTAYKKLK